MTGEAFQTHDWLGLTIRFGLPFLTETFCVLSHYGAEKAQLRAHGYAGDSALPPQQSLHRLFAGRCYGQQEYSRIHKVLSAVVRNTALYLRASRGAAASGKQVLLALLSEVATNQE